MGAGMRVVEGIHAGQSKGVGRMSGDAGGLPECEGKTLMTSDNTAVQVHSSGYGRVGIDRSSWKGFCTGRHRKAQIRCPCSRLAALHGAPRTLVVIDSYYSWHI